ncbi:GH18 family chitinase [Cytobacillus eiseniae]|uniref:chitinase n=1 Tax=Cytobacillus eiseniae TaxID=762947 RepID=A0ABS4RBR7_9BACI|nr:glycoside hydrolase family 18 protein [Cytobacillus eiseniae]MBP2239831.1 GH18 family chitinase [Cytobacillus eiseniae]
MKRAYWILIIIITFTAGCITGSFFSSNTNMDDIKNNGQNPQSTKTVEQKKKPKIIQPKSNVIMGYVQDFRDPDEIDYRPLSHVIFSFAHPMKDGSIHLNGETALNHLRAVVEKAKKHDTKVLLAVGGWFHLNGGESYEYFKEAIAQSTSRTKLVKELIALIEKESIDGIDIDFEHPRSDEDAAYLNALMKELSIELQPIDKELSIAVHSKIHSQSGTELGMVVYDPLMFQYVDHVNIMAYDGQWDGGYEAANLSPYPFVENIVDYWSNLFDEHGYPREKLVLGVPFYAQPEDPNSKQVSYAALINDNPKNSLKDTVNMNGTIYHYNGEATMQKKTEVSLNHGFGGMMLWEMGLDAKGSNSLTAAISEVIQSKDTSLQDN